MFFAGTADWHYLCKFSLTSSQAHGAFVKAFPDFKEDESWIAVAQYMYGDSWRTTLNVPLEDEGDNPDHGVGDYLKNYEFVDDGDNDERDAHSFLLSFVRDKNDDLSGTDDDDEDSDSTSDGGCDSNGGGDDDKDADSTSEGGGDSNGGGDDDDLSWSSRASSGNEEEVINGTFQFYC